ncbi:MAG: hypothetical protein KME54_06745 [Tolypothrix brevis GSE-NOS-MK-07-07A]|nr:hypothetical protein [Tolypothrix brevis GSE-NOS-MK-07-07A]
MPKASLLYIIRKAIARILPTGNPSPVLEKQGSRKPGQQGALRDRTPNSREVYLYLPKIDLYNFHSSLISLLLFFSAFILYPQLPLLFFTSKLYS